MDEFLESIGKLTALATFTVLLLSLAHEWGYFGVIGRELQAFVSAYDYLVSTLTWLPTIIIIWFFLSLAAYGRTSIRTVRSRLDSWMVHVVGLGFVVPAVAGFFWGGAARASLPNVYMLAFLYVWSEFAIRVAPRIADLPKELAVFVLGAPFLMAIALGQGVTAGYRDLSTKDHSYAVKLKDDPGVKEIALLRNFDKGVLVKEADATQIDFYRWDRIDLLSHGASIPTQSHSCELFGWFCRSEADTEIVHPFKYVWRPLRHWPTVPPSSSHDTAQ